jgi:diguanylate cyclase (GGDEF)-like protein
MDRKNTRDFWRALGLILRRGSGVVFRDPLTGLYNRHFFDEIAAKEIARAKRHRHPLTCVLIDVNKLKEINDTYGHQRGDEVLKKLGQLILSNCRQSDIPVRWGGDEFLLLLPETSEEQAQNLIERIVNQSNEVGFSYGITNCTACDSIEEAVSTADEKMYSAKKNPHPSPTL